MSTTSGNKQALIQSIEKLGWHLNNEFIDDLLQDKPNVSLNDLIKTSLDSDFKDIGRKCIPEGITNGKNDCLEGPCVLQLTKVRNIAAPKDNEHLASTNSSIPAFFKIALTDGVTNCTGLIMEDINKLNIDTPPGTKLLLKGNVKTKMSSLLLTNQTCEVLGGHVEQLVSKWKINKDLFQHVRTGNTNEGAPPPWVPFGSKQAQTSNVDTTKKTLKQQINVEDTSSEFSQARQAALAEAVQKQLTITKKFTQQNVVATTPQPVTAPVTDNRPATTLTREPYKREPKSEGGRRGRGRNDEEKSDSAPSKPSQLTLFDLLKTKLPELKGNEQTQQSNDNYKNSTKTTTTTTTNDTPSTTPANSNTTTNTSTTDQQSSTNQYQSNNKRYQQSNNEQSIKDRKNNLPPRLQRANEEQQQQRYNNNNTNTNYQNNRRRIPNNSNKYSNNYEINNNTQQYHYQDQQQNYNVNDYSTTTTTATTTAAATATSGDDTKLQQQQANANKQQPSQPQQQNDNQQQQQQQQSVNNNNNDNYDNYNNYNNNDSYNNYNKNIAKNRRYNNNNNMNQNTKYNSNRNSNPNRNQQQFDYDSNTNSNGSNVNNSISLNYNQYYYPSNRSNYHKQSNKNGYYMQAPPPQQQQVPPPQVPQAPTQMPAGVVPPYINFPIPFYYENPYYPNNPNYPPLVPNGQPQAQTTVQPVPLPVTSSYDPAAYYPIPIPIITPQIPIQPTVAPPQQQQQQPPQPQPQQQQQQQTSPSPPQQQSLPPPQQTLDPQQQQQYDSKSTIINDNNNNISQNDGQLDNTNINKNARNWKIGDRCMARYYHDNRYYSAQIQNIDKNSNMCQVIYDGYEGIENVKFSDLKFYRDNTQRNSHK